MLKSYRVSCASRVTDLDFLFALTEVDQSVGVVVQYSVPKDWSVQKCLQVVEELGRSYYGDSGVHSELVGVDQRASLFLLKHAVEGQTQAAGRILLEDLDFGLLRRNQHCRSLWRVRHRYATLVRETDQNATARSGTADCEYHTHSDRHGGS